MKHFKLTYLINLLVFSLALMFFLIYSQITAPLDLRLLNTFKNFNPSHSSDDIVLIKIDQESLNYFGPLPWPDAHYEPFTNRLALASPQSILFTLPIKINRTDGKIWSLFNRFPNLYLPYNSLAIDKNSLLNQVSSMRYQTYTGFDEIINNHAYNQTYIHSFDTQSALYGNLNYLPYQMYIKEKNMLAQKNTYILPNFKQPFKSISYINFLRKELNLQDFVGKHIIIGVDDASYKQSQGAISAIEIHAQALQSLIQQTAIQPLNLTWQYLVGFACILLTLLCMSQFNPRFAFVICIIASTVVIALSAGLLLFKYWLPPFSTALLVLGMYPLWVQQRMHYVHKFMSSELTRLKQDGLVVAQKNTSHDAFEQQIDLFRSSIARLQDMRQFITHNLNAIPDAIFVIDLKGNVQMSNFAAKKWFASLSLLSEKMHLPSLLAKLVDTQWLESKQKIDWRNLIEFVQSTKAEHEDGFHLNFKQGNYQYVSMRLIPSSNRHDIVVSWLCIFHDFTNKHLAEQQRDDVMKFLSHDMRSPQSSIITSIELYRKQSAYTNVADHTEPLLGKIENYAYRTLKLAEEFVQVSKAESKQYQFDELNFANLAFDVIDEMWPLAHKKHLKIEQNIQEDCYIMGDGPLLTRVLHNLLSNAIKYTPENRRIFVKIHTEKRGTQAIAVCSIKDEGLGISETDQRKLFERYARFHSNQRIEGIGLGLAFVKMVIDGHQGTIRCQSQSGKGSNFIIELTACLEGS